MESLREALEQADQSRVALGHFNVSDLAGFKAITAAARELNVPVLVGVSEGERNFFGVKQIAALVRSVREEYGQQVFLNADHTHSLEKAKAAAEAGFDEIIFPFLFLVFPGYVRGVLRSLVSIAKQIVLHLHHETL